MKLAEAIRGALVVVASAAFIAACAASSPSMARKKDHSKQRPTFDNPKDEIDYLAAEIDTMMGRSGGDSVTGTTDIEADPCAVEPMAADAGYDDCGDVCAISDSICHNAERICHLAEQLAPDDWAEQKCEDANESCAAASDNCDECRG